MHFFTFIFDYELLYYKKTEESRKEKQNEEKVLYFHFPSQFSRETRTKRWSKLKNHKPKINSIRSKIRINSNSLIPVNEIIIIDQLELPPKYVNWNGFVLIWKKLRWKGKNGMRIIQMGILKIKFCVIMIENQLRCLHLHLHPDLVTLNIMYLNLIHWLVLQSNMVLRYFSTNFVFLVFLCYIYKVWLFFGCLEHICFLVAFNIFCFLVFML